jgi:benzoyl-CoA reductase/2-hydroxyglutaryl-CoA dehydratase subunit BcrC/BadD/HgdB
MDAFKKWKEGALVVWGAIVIPAEIFRGFENVVYCVPETHAALCAAKNVGPELCQRAEALGYSMDLCSYPRIDIGWVSGGRKISPTSGLPKPGLLVSDNNDCSLLTKWFDVHHRNMNIPHFMVDVPFCYGPQEEKDLEYIVEQFRDLISLVEKMTGQTFNIDRFFKASIQTALAMGEWKRFLECAKNRPSGITAFDSFAQMAPFFTSRGTPEMVEHYRILADETEERVKEGDFPVPDEKYRLLWDNIAPWHQMSRMSTRLMELGANIIAAPYTLCIGGLEGSFELFQFSLDKDPLWYMARTQNMSVCPYGLDLRTDAMSWAIEELGIDGVIFASNRSCKVFSVMQMDQQRRISEKFDIPTVMIEMDHADARKFSEESAYMRLEALLENIESRRAAA